MNAHTGAELASCEARALDLAKLSDRGVFAVSEFLSPREVYIYRAALSRGGYGSRTAACGGVRDAERKKLIIVPDYAVYEADEGNSGESAAEIAAQEAASEEIRLIRVAGSGYAALTHRDFMGAILALGIKRGVIGDIIVDADGHGAYIFCDAKICRFITSELSRVGSDAVRVSECETPAFLSAAKRTVTVSDSVASMRADCVIAALINCPRERAKAAISSGAVERNYELLTKPDATLDSGDVISVRGYGKFIISGTDGQTRRGRLRLVAEKYI